MLDDCKILDTHKAKHRSFPTIKHKKFDNPKTTGLFLFEHLSNWCPSMKHNTKQKILEIASEIIHLKGYNHTGIQEILNAASVPKGSFYNYFKNKEDFGLQVIEYYVDYYAVLANRFLRDSDAPPVERIRRFLDSFIDFFESRDFAYGCPVGNLAQEMGDISPAFRKKLKYALDAMADIYAEILEEAQKKGDISRDLDVRETACFIVSSWHGALMHMKAEKGPGPLKNHSKFIFNYILKT